ncbi:TRAP transporter substrate-binding protein [Chelativorans sp. M5D2P16]|uniref:TRAP transporter substrate-binding protein n=1 Tax=Chelativorans sp. M5D2P16 TaxID=3095678 RepID=UPI002ACA8F18|nr:TRAP transporter substrate-binding protein [Chelativorans sp. M5D2P16]MDZ5696615.1 TRAP transporter substrate-binding protein [Chelativorans sp. M5D2P16]
MSGEPVRLRIGGYQGPNSVLTAGLKDFAAELEQAAPGAFGVEETHDVTAGGTSARALFDGLESGAFDIGYMASGYLTARVPQLAVIDLPLSRSDRHAAYAALDGEAGRMLRAAVEADTGYRVLGFWDNGFRHLTNGRRPIRAPRDCAGLVVRTLDNRIYRETMAAMGFKPVVTDVKELREAVASGQVDAQENPLTNAVVFELWRHHRHVSLTGHFFGVVLLLANARWLSELPEGPAAAVRRAAAAATAEQRRLAEAQDVEALDFLRAKGVSILPPEELDRDGFRTACRGIVESELAGLDPALVAAYLGEPAGG